MKKVIIIGGGFAGTLAAKKLESKFDVTLIDTKDYFEFTPGVLRTIVEPEHLGKIQILHKDYIKGNVIVGHISNITKDHIDINGKKISFDYLVIASGSEYNSPFKEEDIVIATRGYHLKKYNEKLCRSKKVLIVGGGLVGVELAGEIITHYPDKEVRIVHAHHKLIERNPEFASRFAEKFLKKRKVKLEYEQFITKKEGRHFFSDKEKKYEHDIAFLCTGIKPSYNFMKRNFSECIFDKKGLIVNSHLQLKGYTNIFAAGDVTSISEEKTAQNAERQAKIAAKNIIAIEKGKKLVEYKSKKTPIVLSLGKYQGIFIWGNFIFTGIIPAIMKWGIEKKEIWRRKLL